MATTRGDGAPGPSPFALLGLLLFAISWFVPVHEMLSGARELGRSLETLGAPHSEGPLRSGPQGWLAARFAWDLLTNDGPSHEAKVTALGLTSLTNVVMVIAALAVLVRARSGARAIGVALLGCAVLDAGWLYLTDGDFRSGLQAGYWLWLASFGVVGFGLAGGTRS